MNELERVAVELVKRDNEIARLKAVALQDRMACISFAGRVKELEEQSSTVKAMIAEAFDTDIPYEQVLIDIEKVLDGKMNEVIREQPTGDVTKLIV